jgi:hypothetical protein
MADNLTDAAIGAGALVIVSLITLYGSRLLSRAQKNLIDVDVLGKLTAQILALQTEQNRLYTEHGKLQNQIEAFEDTNRILWSYCIELVEFVKMKGHIPPEPPAALETNPKLMKLLNQNKK